MISMCSNPREKEKINNNISIRHSTINKFPLTTLYVPFKVYCECTIITHCCRGLEIYLHTKQLSEIVFRSANTESVSGVQSIFYPVEEGANTVCLIMLYCSSLILYMDCTKATFTHYK